MNAAAERVRKALLLAWSSWLGRVGLVLLVGIIVVSLVAAVLIPPGFHKRWDDLKYWASNPRLAPPDWVSALGVQRAPHVVASLAKPSTYQVAEGYVTVVYELRYSLQEEDYPQNVFAYIGALRRALNASNTANLPAYALLKVVRPDGYEAKLAEATAPLGSLANSSLSVDPHTAIPEVKHLVVSVTGMSESTFVEKYEQEIRAGALYVQYIFGTYSYENGVLTRRPLKGVYRVQLVVRVPQVEPVASKAPGGLFDSVTLVVVGNRYGYLGTDLYGRDLALGLLYGFPVALLIGFVAAVTSTFLGAILGMVSGYFGGAVDEVVQRAVDVIGNIPLLPILILISSIVQTMTEDPWTRIFAIVGTLIVFGWGGTARVTRAMVLSIKAEPYIEAARAAGAGSARIVLRHVFPQILPYLFASLVFSVPGAILTEAGLSLLGIRHGLPTWGLILATAREASPTSLKAWWWIFPPGAMLALTSFTFVALGMALETIIDPRLRGR